MNSNLLAATLRSFHLFAPHFFVAQPPDWEKHLVESDVRAYVASCSREILAF